MREILSDLVAEEQSLDQFLQRINPRDWRRTSVWHGWTIHETVSHLAASEEYAYNALAEGGSRLDEIEVAGGIDALNTQGLERGVSMRPQDVIEWWRGARAKVVEELSRRKPTDRVPWFYGDMSAKSFATARLMETWAHGIDVYYAVGEEPEETTRIRHVAWLAWKSLPYAFKEAGEEYPEPVRAEFRGPNYSKWVFGPADATNVIRGEASEWAALAVDRIDLEDTETLTAEGDLAQRALELVRVHL